MFTSFDHFKKATHSLFKETCRSGIKLSQYRDIVSQSLGFQNIQAVKSHFENLSSEPKIVSVILYINDCVHSKYDFYDTVEGNKKAEDFFRKNILEYNPSFDDEDVDDFLDDGYYEDDNSDYQIFIVHSY